MLNHFKILACLLFLSLTVSFCSSKKKSNAGIALLVSGVSNSPKKSECGGSHSHSHNIMLNVLGASASDHHDSKVDTFCGWADEIRHSIAFQIDKGAHGSSSPSSNRWYKAEDFQSLTLHDNTTITVGIMNMAQTPVADINTGNNVITIGTYSIAPKISKKDVKLGLKSITATKTIIGSKPYTQFGITAIGLLANEVKGYSNGFEQLYKEKDTIGIAESGDQSVSSTNPAWTVQVKAADISKVVSEDNGKRGEDAKHDDHRLLE